MKINGQQHTQHKNQENATFLCTYTHVLFKALLNDPRKATDSMGPGLKLFDELLAIALQLLQTALQGLAV